jgi:flagellar biosynthesis chaperone FliJ
VSLPPDPDEPTRRLPPTEPAEPIREREVVTSHELEPVWVQEVLDRLRSLRTAVGLLGVVAVAALGVALWALLTQEEEDDARRGASSERVRDLEDRVDNLESGVRDAASGDAVDRLREGQERLDERLRAVEDQAGGPSDGMIENLQRDMTQLGEAIEQTGETLEDLEQRVDELERQQTGAGASP